MPVEFWAHAVSTAAYTINRLSHKRLPNGITPYECMHGTKPNISNMRVFGCHAEILIEKQYRKKDLTESHSESAIFIGYCRQSTGYVFYIPHKHQVVSRRDASFNQAYFPARVGETMLIDKDTIKIGTSETIPSIETVGDKPPNKKYLDDLDSSPHSVEQAGEPPSLDAKEPPKKTPSHIDNSLDLLSDCDSIIRVSTKIEKSSPHIYMRCNGADGLSITQALSTKYTHINHPKKEFMYKKNDIKYDIQRGWIFLVPPTTEASGGIELSLEPEAEENNSNNVGAETPLSEALTRSVQSSRPSRVASQHATSRIRSSFSSSGRPIMPEALRDDDSISAMLERGTLERDFALSMQALGFGDEPTTYKERLLRHDSHKWAEAEDIEWDAIKEYGTFKWITYEEMYKINPFARVISTKWCYKRKPDRYKARVVARGFLQSPWDVGETHSNVAKLSSGRATLSKAAVNDYSIRQIDIGNAYLCADLSGEHVFCSPPEGRENPGYVMYLQKALYGLKNSAKAWFDTFSSYLKSLGYTQSHYDGSIRKTVKSYI